MQMPFDNSRYWIEAVSLVSLLDKAAIADLGSECSVVDALTKSACFYPD
jgi:hypothetical protein